MSDAVSKALAKLAAAIGGRAGLEELQGLFDEMDTDGSGDIDFNEFQAGLASFGIGEKDLDAGRVRAIFDAVDTSGDGNINVDEFSQIAKCELELLTLTEHFGGTNPGGEVAAERDKLAAALKTGVRVNRSASTMYDKKLQGDLDMLTEEALAARQKIKDDPSVRKFVEGWWNMVDLKTDNGNMDKNSYCCMSIALHKHFVADVTDEEALESAEDDWETDCPPGRDAMTFGKFLAPGTALPCSQGVFLLSSRYPGTVVPFCTGIGIEWGVCFHTTHSANSGLFRSTVSF
jgi:hypothetical protein